MNTRVFKRERARERQGARTDLDNIPDTCPECSGGESRDAVAEPHDARTARLPVTPAAAFSQWGGGR